MLPIEIGATVILWRSLPHPRIQKYLNKALSVIARGSPYEGPCVWCGSTEPEWETGEYYACSCCLIRLDGYSASQEPSSQKQPRKERV